MSRYSVKVFEHLNSPRNAGAMPGYTVVGEANWAGRTPNVEIYLRVERNVVSQASFTASGCGVTIACCSALTELAKEKPLDEVRRIKATDVAAELDLPADKLYCAEVVVAAVRAAIDQIVGEG